MASLMVYMSYMEISVCVGFVYFSNTKIDAQIKHFIFEICILDTPQFNICTLEKYTYII